MQLTLGQEGGQLPYSRVVSTLCFTKMNLVSINYLDLFQHAREERKETREIGEKKKGKDVNHRVARFGEIQLLHVGFIERKKNH